MGIGIIAGNTSVLNVITFTFDAASVTANTTVEQDITIQGLKTTDFVAVNKPSLSAGVGIVNARVKAANTLSVQYVNATGVAVNPASETYTLLVVRPEGLGSTKIAT
jgi:hypothetical protein